MANAKETLPKLMELDGCVGACIVDSNSGMTLASAGWTLIGATSGAGA